MKYRYLIFASAVAFAIGISACGDSKAEANSNVKRSNLVTVKVQDVELTDFAETIKLTGTVQSANDIIVPAETSGRIVEWFVEKGDYVTKGQILAQIDDAMQKSSHAAAEANYKMADVNYEKQRKAFEEQAISELQLKNLEFQRDAAKAQADAAKQMLDHTRIVAPVNGVVNDRFVDEGEMIGTGSPAAHVVDMSNIKIDIGVPERYAGELKSGSIVEFTVDAYPEKNFQGRIGFIAPAVNPDNRTIPVEVRIANQGSLLKPNMIARVTIKLQSAQKTVVILQDYVQQIDMNRSVVYIAHGDSASERPVTLGGTDGKNVRVLKGLSPGDKLITAGYQSLVDGQKINIQE